MEGSSKSPPTSPLVNSPGRSPSKNSNKTTLTPPKGPAMGQDGLAANGSRDHKLIEIPVQTGFANNNSSKFEGHLPEGDEGECDQNQDTLTSLSGKPLLAPAAARLAKSNREKRMKKQKRKNAKEQLEVLRLRFVPPDGGYGWFIAFAAFLVQFWIAGLIKSYGVIYMEILQLFPESSASLASWIPAILSTLCLVCSPISSALCQKYTCRSVVYAGAILCWLGISLSFFATNLVQLCFTFGVLTGIGAGLSTTPGIIMTSRYFDKHRALANGICVSGTAAGSMVIPPLMEWLVPLYGFRGSILILGGCVLNVCVSAALYRPIEVHQNIVEISQRKRNLNADDLKDLPEDVISVEDPPSPPVEPAVTGDVLQVPNRMVLAGIPEDSTLSLSDEISMSGQRSPRVLRRSRASRMFHSIDDLSTDSTVYYKDTKSVTNVSCDVSLRHPAAPSSPIPDSKTKCWQPNIGRYLDLSLTKNPLFLLITSTVMLMAVGCPHVLFFVPAFANSRGISKADSSLLLSISAVLDLAGRLIFGWVADLNLFSNHRAYSLSVLLSGISVFFIPLATSFESFAVIVSCYGLGLGCWFLLIPVLLREHHGTEAIASSYGLVRLFQGIITLVTPPSVGFIRDSTGDYVVGFYAMGACMVTSGVIVNFIPLVKNHLRQREPTRS